MVVRPIKVKTLYRRNALRLHNRYKTNMLDTTTKKRIDDCRDILVGKLPDPKAQIEQITIGLIYKFMDDMDKEAIELGGSAKFFSGDYEKYAWDKLFDTKVTAAEMLRLYSEAIESMEKNPNIPQLFRDIFNNAYLPYRDPETLKLFLKTIGEFEYTHSEKLGDAFEYLLSVMGSQGDAGQFRTPRHIIDFLVAIIDPDKGETILDPACGTAGFLISAYKHILLKYSTAAMHCGSTNIYHYNQLPEEKKFPLTGDQLTPDDRKKLIQNFAGYDISPDMVRLSLVNLYLHGFSDPHINEYDTLSSEDRWNENFDVVLANPPFMSPKGGIRPHKKFTISSNRSEVLFVDYIAEHLNPKGKAGIIVPEGVIFQSGTAYKDLRKMLVENYLYAVVSLPAGVFNPYSGVKTSILLMDKAFAKQRNEILFVKIDNDGYNLGAQRAAVKGSQLEDAIQIIHDFIASGRDAMHSRDAMHCVSTIENSTIAHLVPKTEIAANGDYNLSGDRYRGLAVSAPSDYPEIKLSEIVELVRGVTYSKKDEVDKDGLKILRANNIDITNKLNLDDVKLVSQSVNVSERQKLKKGDVFICVASGSANHIGKVAFIPEDLDYYFGGFMGAIRPIIHDAINPEYLFYNLTNERFNIYLNRVIAGANIKNINKTILGDFQIPLPPLSIQEEIVAEIEGYQKIIDGAKAVVANYKPKIDIDPDWEMVELGEVCEITSSKRIFKEEYVESGVPFYRTKEIVELSNGLNPSLELFISEERYQEIKEKFDIPKQGEILVSAVGTLGVSWIVNHDNPFYFKDGNLVWIKNLKENANPIFIKQVLDIFIPNQIHVLSAGAAYKALTIVKLKQLQIPFPDLETQHQIVVQIEKEQVLVNANKQLIEIFEQKIKDRIAKVWGTSTSSAQVEKSEEERLNMAAEPVAEYEK